MNGYTYCIYLSPLVDLQELLPRLYEAIRLKNKKFVIHDGCQQKIRDIFYDPR